MDNSLIIAGGVLLGSLIGISWFAGTDAPYVATKTARIKKVLKLARIKKGQKFFELGSGDGRVVLEAAKMGTDSFGIEQSLIRVFLSKWQAKKQNLPNAKFIHGNIFSVIAKTWQSNSPDIVFIFLLPKGIEKLEPILKKELKKGSIVITQSFHFPNWKPYKKILITDKNIPNTPLGKNVVEGDFWFYKK